MRKNLYFKKCLSEVKYAIIVKEQRALRQQDSL